MFLVTFVIFGEMSFGIITISSFSLGCITVFKFVKISILGRITERLVFLKLQEFLNGKHGHFKVRQSLKITKRKHLTSKVCRKTSAIQISCTPHALDQ